MSIWQRLRARLGGGSADEVAALRQRVQKLEQALQDSKRRQTELAEQLKAQREKTRELYQRTRDYAERLQRKG